MDIYEVFHVNAQIFPLLPEKDKKKKKFIKAMVKSTIYVKSFLLSFCIFSVNI